MILAHAKFTYMPAVKGTTSGVTLSSMAFACTSFFLNLLLLLFPPVPYIVFARLPPAPLRGRSSDPESHGSLFSPLPKYDSRLCVFSAREVEQLLPSSARVKNVLNRAITGGHVE